MAKVFALYKKPADAKAFDDHYYNKQVPLAKTLPGLRGYEVTRGPIMTPQGESVLHLVAILSFDSMAAIQQALASPQGVATAGDLVNFAEAGVDLLFADSDVI